MQYPYNCSIHVGKIFDETISIVFYSPITVFVGANGLGKTQTLKSLRDALRKTFGNKQVKYLSSNRIGTMELYRSKSDNNSREPNSFSFGGKYEQENRHIYETAMGDFFTLDEKKDVYIKISERLSVLFHRQIYLRWDAGHLKVFFGRTDSEEEYSVAAEASGLVNLISILTELYDDESSFLLIDEPEVSLHPQLQSFILREMQTVSKKYEKTIILSTHSSSMIPFESVECISNIVFFSEGETPKQISPDASELNNRKLKEFVMRMGQIYKEGFFAKRVLLVEGASDNIICKFLLNKLDMNADAAGTQLIPVDGKGQFSSVAKLFRLIGKEVIILTDLDGFIDDNSIINLFACLPKATQMANTHGFESLSEMIRSIKAKITSLTSVDKQSELKDIYEKHPYWECKDKDNDIEKCIIRSMIGMLFLSTIEEIRLWPDGEQWIQIETRLITAFDILESLGCFVLRRGAIESYYIYSDNATYDEKPSKAVEEIERLQEQENIYICGKYDDIIRALKHVTQINEIDEGYAIRKELLSELALAIEVLPRIKDSKGIYSAIKQSKGSLSTLFAYSIVEKNGKKGIEVGLNSSILDVQGFPFTIFPGDNVNDIVSKNIMHK